MQEKMEKRHRCKLCLRNFANGRALGGHMRSHVMKFYDEAKKKQQETDFRSINSFASASISQSSFSSPSSSSSEEGSAELQAAVMEDHGFYAGFHDWESGMVSTKKRANRVGRRSNRVSRTRVPDVDGFFPVKKRSKFSGGVEDERSSISDSDTTPEEHLARCLIMLSRDKWTRAEVEFHSSDDDFAVGLAGKGKFCDNYDDSKSYGMEKLIKAKVRGKYRCDECNKLFKSYQALGGHRASHKKVRIESTPPDIHKSGSIFPAAMMKLHECPFCHRTFPSGQALGGHKRSHFIGHGGGVLGNANNTSPVKQSSRSGEALDIDLNRPAPADDDEGRQVLASLKKS